MTVTKKQFVAAAKGLIRDDILPSMKNKSARFLGGAVLRAINDENFGVLAEIFPALAMVKPLLASSGVFDEDGDINVGKLEDILVAGFESSGGELPVTAHLFGKDYEVNITPKTWEAFLERLS